MGIGVRGTTTSLAFVALATLSACSGYPLDAIPLPLDKPADHVELVPNAEIDLPVPGQQFAPQAEPVARSEDVIAEVDWKTAAPVRIMLLEYTFAPHETVLNEGTAYRLVLSNIGDKDHTFKAPSFLRAIAVRSLSTIPIDEAGVQKYERDDAGQSDPPEGLLRLEVEEIPPPPPLGEEDAGAAAPANPFDSNNDEEEEAPAGTNPFDSDDEEDIGDEDEDASRSQVPGTRYALGPTKARSNSPRRTGTQPSPVSEVASVTAETNKKAKKPSAIQIDGEFEDDLPARPETTHAATKKQPSNETVPQPTPSSSMLLAQQLIGQETEIEDDDFVYRPGSNTPIRRDDEDDKENEENSDAGGDTPATDTPANAQDFAEEPSEESESTDSVTSEATPATAQPAEDSATDEADAKPEPDEVDETVAEGAVEGDNAAKSLPPLPLPRVVQKQGGQSGTEVSEPNDSDSDAADAEADDANGAEDEDLADLEEEAREEREAASDSASDEAEGTEGDGARAADAASDRTEDSAADPAEDAPPSVDEPELIEPEILASLLKKGVIEVPARRAKLIHFVAVRKGRYHVSTLSFIDNAHWMRGTIIIE